MRIKKLFLTLPIIVLLVSCSSSSNHVDNNISSYTEKETYVVTFDASGGVIESGLEKQTVSSPKEIVAPVVSKNGYTFLEWNMEISTIYEETTVSAIWTIKDYDIIYELNDDETNNMLNPSRYNVKSFVSLSPATKKGFTFMCWKNKETADVVSIIDGRNLEGTLTLIPVFKLDYYSITYELNGGVFETIAPEKYSCLDEVKIPNPAKTGYTFIGWTGWGYSNIKDLIIPMDTFGCINLVANFTPNQYTVSLDTKCNIQYDDIIVAYDSTLSLPTPSRDGYYFIGWYNEETKIPLSSTYTYTSDLSLTAKWGLYSYRVYKYYSKGTTSTNYKSQYQTFNVETSVTIEPFYLTGYDFVGWFFKDDPTNLFQTYTVPVGTHQTIEVYTNLIPQKFHIYFDPNGGTMESTSMEVEYDKYYYSFPTPKREHYQFLGWVDENNNEVTKIQYNKTEDTYLTAAWQSLE